MTNDHIKWFEIPATDFERSVKFYSELLGLCLDTNDCGEEKMAFFPGTSKNAGGSISWTKDFTPSADGPLIYFDATAGLDQLLEKVVACGGKVVVPKTRIGAEGRGSFALFEDTEGNRLGFHAD